MLTHFYYVILQAAHHGYSNFLRRDLEEMGSSLFPLLNSVEPWMWLSAAILLLPIAASLGEVNILPWLSLSLIFVGIADALSLNIEFQLITFCSIFLCSIILSHKFLSSDISQPLIAESIQDMVGKEITVKDVSAIDSLFGIAVSETGKSWEVQSSENTSLEKNKIYRCSGYTGITLKIMEI